MGIFKKDPAGALIREAIDACPDGICAATPEGRPILVNRAMNQICFELTGHTVTNAAVMRSDIEKAASKAQGGIPALAAEEDPHNNACEQKNPLIVIMKDGRVWQFAAKDLELEHGKVVQYEASDVTELYEYRQRLADNNRRVAELHRRQRDLLENIVRNNTEKELLEAKVSIHDNIGRLLIRTGQALDRDVRDEEADELFESWRNEMDDLVNSSEQVTMKENTPEKELLKVAEMIGCKVFFEGEQPAERESLLLLYAAIREALTNAVRHAGADELRVAIEKSADVYLVTISDNGSASGNDPFHEGGGLGSLRKRLEQAGGSMRVDSSEGFVLHIELPLAG
ncbi:MAG: hypothetical protein K5637_00505 [Lachnospiraceae bacterium]|nr:hypothetical protein [Lachnospiraceae bacterium]